jgi:hypothetical protein
LDSSELAMIYADLTQAFFSRVMTNAAVRYMHWTNY